MICSFSTVALGDGKAAEQVVHPLSRSRDRDGLDFTIFFSVVYTEIYFYTRTMVKIRENDFDKDKTARKFT